MEAYSGNGGTAVLIPNLTTIWGEWSASCPDSYIPVERSLLPLEYEAGWFPEQVRMFCTREKSLAPAKSKFLECLVL